MGKYFGTDGFRGVAGKELTAEHAFKIGRFLGCYLNKKRLLQKSEKRAKVAIGKDTRLSSYMLEYSLVGGLVSSGADAYLLHVTTTPSVAYITHVDGFDCGIMISASHNPYYDNGIKLIGPKGEKMDESITNLIENYLDGKVTAFGEDLSELPFSVGEDIGRSFDFSSGRSRYAGYLISIGTFCFKGIKIGLDCSNGSTWSIAKNVFDSLGGETFVIANEPDGKNINKNCGSTNIENLQSFVIKNNLDIGFAFDGDGDRCIAVDENGEIVDGDGILYISGKYLKEHGRLKDDTVVTTVMSNYGLYRAFEKVGIKSEITAVGDRFVHECMAKGGYSLGGEQSGHIIFSKYAATGDGILTSLMLMEVILRENKSLGKLKEGFVRFPQTLINVKVSNKKKALSSKKLWVSKEKIEKELNHSGRILIRESGTEPVIRVMVECDNEEKCKQYANDLAALIES